MPFGTLWKKNGGFLENISSDGINIVGPDGPGDSFKIKMQGDEAQLITNEKLTIESPGGTYRMAMDEYGTKFKDGYIEIQASNGEVRFKTNSTGLGFFATTPVAQQTKPASPAADPAALKTAVDGIMEALAAYGLLTS